MLDIGPSRNPYHIATRHLVSRQLASALPLMPRRPVTQSDADNFRAFEVDDATTRAAVNDLVTLVNVDATSGQEAAISEAFVAFGERLGLPVERVRVTEGRDNILFGDPHPSLVFCTHMDTVPPHFGAACDAYAVSGRGSADAKGVAVAMAYALKLLRESGGGEGVACWFVVGEETDHAGAKAMLDHPHQPKTVVLGEPCGGMPARGQKGLLKLRLRAQGSAAHSAYPELGVSATHALIQALSALIQAELPEDRTALGQTTLNVGLVSGGLAANVVAPSAEAVVLIRCAAPVDAIMTAVASTIEGCLGPTIEIEELNRAEPLEFSCDPRELGIEPGDPVPFNTDAHTLRPMNARMLLMGPGDMRTCHGPDEHLPIAELRKAIENYAKLAVRLR